jgi:hypothetical protein
MELPMRLLIQIQESAKPHSQLPERVQTALQSAGASQIRASHPELPGLFTAVVPDSCDVDELLGQLLAFPEVRHAEPDSLRGTA